MKIIVDAYAWVEIFIGSDKGNNARESLTEADATHTSDVGIGRDRTEVFERRSRGTKGS